MKIETKWNLGNFTVALEAEADGVVLAKLQSLGLLYLGQRNSGVDKILGGFEKKGDKQVRKVGWKRTDIPFTVELAKALSESFELMEVLENVPIESRVVVTEYDGPDKAEPKFAREKKKFAEKESTPAGLEAWLKSFCGYAGPTHGEDKEYAVEALVAAKAAIDKFLRENI